MSESVSWFHRRVETREFLGLLDAGVVEDKMVELCGGTWSCHPGSYLLA